MAVTAAWRPHNDLERALARAAAENDVRAYRSALVRANLVLPVTAGAARGEEPVRWMTGTADGRTFALAFTSPEEMVGAIGGAGAYRLCPFVDLGDEWPDRSWWLAIDPGTPIELYLPADAVVTAASEARGATESALRAAAAAGDTDRYLTSLLGGDIVVPVDPGGGVSRDVGDPDFPWWRVDLPRGAAIVVFTSVQRLSAELVDRDADWVELPFIDVVAAWPTGHAMAINPGTPLAGHLPAGTVANLADFVARASAAAAAGAERAADEAAGSDYARDMAAQRAAREAVQALVTAELVRAAGGHGAALPTNDGG